MSPPDRVFRVNGHHAAFVTAMEWSPTDWTYMLTWMVHVNRNNQRRAIRKTYPR